LSCTPSIPTSITFHNGGIIPGPPGREVQITALAGEAVFNEAQQRALFGGQAPARAFAHAGLSGSSSTPMAAGGTSDPALVGEVRALRTALAGLRPAPAIGHITVDGSRSPERTLAEIVAGAEGGRFVQTAQARG
jgi:hypothetical protein